VKHSISPWLQRIEQEINLKLFDARGDRFVNFNLDGLLRGAFTERMQGYATSITHGIRTSNEIRALENLPPVPEGDRLMIQGATVPLATAGEQPEPVTAPEPEGEEEEGEDDDPRD